MADTQPVKGETDRERGRERKGEKERERKRKIIACFDV